MFFIKYTIFLTFLLFHLSSCLIMKKCCGPGLELKIASSSCAEITGEDLQKNELWFPIDAALNGSTLQLMNSDQRETAKQSLKVTSYGFPDCLPIYKVKYSFYMGGVDDEFRIVLGNHEEKSGIFLGSASTDLPQLKEIDDSSWLVPFKDACLDSLFVSGELIYVVAYCPTIHTPWIRKCCPTKELYNTFSEKCEGTPIDFDAVDWKPHQANHMKRYYLRKNSRPSCKILTVVNSYEKSWRCRGFSDPSEFNITFLPSGSLQIAENAIYKPNEYCGEKTWHEGDREIHDNYVVCGTKPTTSTLSTVYGVLLIIGGAFLLATVSISLWLPELRRSLHNLIAITHNATLMITSFWWGIYRLSGASGIVACVINGLIIQFMFLASLMWLNAMCINMSFSFRLQGRSDKDPWKRYLKYSVYAWGLTTVISVITITMEFIEEPPLGIPRPGISCYCDFARHTNSVLVYFYGPMALILLCNTVLYVMTAFKITKLYQQTKVVRKSSTTAGSSSMGTEKQRLIVYTKLFILTGVTWLSEIISWTSQNQNVFFTLLDIINLLRAIFIFVIFICKKEIFYSIQREFQTLVVKFRSSITCKQNFSLEGLNSKPNLEELEMKEKGTQNLNIKDN